MKYGAGLESDIGANGIFGVNAKIQRLQVDPSAFGTDTISNVVVQTYIGWKY